MTYCTLPYCLNLFWDFILSGIAGLLAGALVVFWDRKFYQKKFQVELAKEMDALKEEARKTLFRIVIKETLRLAHSCSSFVWLVDDEKIAKKGSAVLNDRYDLHIEQSFATTIQFSDQLSLFSGILDDERVRMLSDIAARVSRIRDSLIVLRSYGPSFFDRLEYLVPNDPNPYHKRPREASLVPSTKIILEGGLKESNVKGLYYIVSRTATFDRQENIRIDLAILIHNLMVDAAVLCSIVECFAKNKKTLSEAEYKDFRRQMREEDDLKIQTLEDQQIELVKIAKSIQEFGLYLVKHVFHPATLYPKHD